MCLEQHLAHVEHSLSLYSGPRLSWTVSLQVSWGEELCLTHLCFFTKHTFWQAVGVK